MTSTTRPHEPIEIHELRHDEFELTEDSPLVGHACRACTPRDLVTELDAGELIDTEKVVWWPCNKLAETPKGNR